MLIAIAIYRDILAHKGAARIPDYITGVNNLGNF